MERCLGIYIGDKIIKYAKLHMDKNKNIDVETSNVKYVLGGIKEVIDEIIVETNSQNTPISINLLNEHHENMEILKQISKNDISSMVELEIEDIANKQGINNKLLLYKFNIQDSLSNKDNNKISILYTDRTEIEQYSKVEGFDVKGAYPLSTVMKGLISKEEKSYAIVNIEERITISIVLNGNLIETIALDVGMKEVIESLAEQLGSYAKAYDMCKTINVYTEDENPNNPEIEKIVEPLLQEILRKIEESIKPFRGKFDKLFLSGMGVLFTNIDILFEQYYGMQAEILKPAFTKGEVGIRNMAELIEANSAIALANALLTSTMEDVNFMLQINKKQAKLADGKGSKSKLGVKLPHGISFNGDAADVIQKLIFANLVAGTVLIGYVVFGSIYSAQTNKVEKNIRSSISNIEEQSALVKVDVDYINKNKNEYKEINEMVTDIVNKIQSNEIGSLRTYNVANFMQKIMKFVPSNVQLVSIESNDNKHVTISAKSSSYAALGYFVSQLKLEGIINNVKINSVSHGTEISVSIGGDLP